MRNKLLGGLLLFVAVASAAQSSKLAPELKGTPNSQNVSVIVQFKTVPPAGKTNTDRVVSSRTSAQLSVINAVTAIVPASSLAALAADSSVAYVSPDRKVHGHLNNA